MASIFSLVDYGPVETLKAFSSRFVVQSSYIEFDGELESVWISHRSMKNLKEFTMGLKDDHFNIQCKKIHSNPFEDLYFILQENCQNHFSPEIILKKMLESLHCCLAEYVLTQCLVLYNWGINSFELVFDNEEFYMKLLKNGFNPKRKNVFRHSDEDFRKWRFILTNWKKKLNLGRNNSDLFDEEEGRKELKYYKRRRRCRKECNYREIERIYKECDRRGRYGITTKFETFSNHSILYDMKHRLWPKNHALSSSTTEEFLNAIMKVELKEKAKRELPNLAGSDWHALKRILGIILKNHKTLTLYDGYRRLLKRHLKVTGFSARKSPNRMLEPIPSSSVSSYIVLVLHKVVPFEFFESNRLKKKFYREILKIINGGKNEIIFFKPLIRMFSDVKNKLTWIQEIQDHGVATRIISKILKWLLLDYIFLILKNHFYITEIGSSGYRLYYYRKNDIEGAVTRWLNQEIRKENLRMIEGDLDHWKSIERKWVETGKIFMNTTNLKLEMDEGTEFISPVSNVRFLPKSEENSEMRIITSYRIKKTLLRSNDVQKREMAKFFYKKYMKRAMMWRKVKLLLKYLTDKYGTGIIPLPNNPKLESAWSKALHLKETNGKLYYIKADVSDAFGSVLPSLLGAIIDEKLRLESNQVMQTRTMKECRVRNGRIECYTRNSFSDRPSENAFLISRTIFVGFQKKLTSYRSSDLKKILDQVIHHQYLNINGKCFRLTRGLTQGSAGSVSPFLCNLYYSEMDRIHFKEFISSNDCILLRAVDDYLMLTSNIEKAKRFYEIVFNGIKEFNVTFNRKKLMSNLAEGSSCVNYLGLIFNVKDSSVRPDYARYIKKDLLSYMKLSDIYCDIFYQKTRFIYNRTLRIIPLKLLSVTLNGLYNAPNVIREILYSASVIQSNRILVLALHLTRGNDQNDLDLCVILSKSIQRTVAVAIRLNQNVTKFEICWLFWKAAFFVFRKYSGSFPMLLTLIRNRINVLEARSKKSEFACLLHSMKEEMAHGETWRNLQETLKMITVRSKPTKRFR